MKLKSSLLLASFLLIGLNSFAQQAAQISPNLNCDLKKAVSGQWALEQSNVPVRWVSDDEIYLDGKLLDASKHSMSATADQLGKTVSIVIDGSTLYSCKGL